MRVLLVAYEFPPSPSPQSLRWAYISRELESLGVELEVIVPRLPISSSQQPSCSRARVERVFPGPFMGLLGLARRVTHSTSGHPAHSVAGGALEYGPTTLNWKGRCIEWFQHALGRLLFPDIRGEWTPWAKRALKRRLREFRPDVVVTSHEPANVLVLGRIVRLAGARWVADLGDPVLASYTPDRWRRRAYELEAEVCKLADQVTVTSTATRDLLIRRHGVLPYKINVVTQGYDAEAPVPAAGSASDGLLQLVYTGSLYGFRRIDSLIHAVLNSPGICLSIASRSIPDGLISLQEQHPSRIRLLGPLPHQRALALQRGADILIDLGNDSPEQVPGKFYEYLGAMRPIMHIGSKEGAAVGHLENLRRGWWCNNNAAEIAGVLTKLRGLKLAGRLDEGLDLGSASVASYSWQAQARRMHGLLAQAVAGGGIQS